MMSFCGGLAPTKCSKQLSHHVSVCKYSVMSSYLSYPSCVKSLFAVRVYLGRLIQGRSQAWLLQTKSCRSSAGPPPPPGQGELGEGSETHETESLQRGGKLQFPLLSSVWGGQRLQRKGGVSSALGRGPSCLGVAQGTRSGAGQLLGCFQTDKCLELTYFCHFSRCPNLNQRHIFFAGV